MTVRHQATWVLALGLFFAGPARAQDVAGEVPVLRANGTGHGGRVSSGVFSPDGTHFFSACDDRTVRAWNVADGKHLFTLAGHQAGINAIGLSGDNLLVTGAEDGSIFLWDIALRKQVGQLPRHQQPMSGLAISKDGKLLATCGGTWTKPQKGELRLWDLGKRAQIAALDCAGQAFGVAFSPDGKTLASVDRAGDIKLWDLATLKAATVHSDKSPWSVAFSPDGKQLAVGDMHGRITIYDPVLLSDEAVVRAHRGTVACLSFALAPRGTMLASAGLEGDIRLHNAGDLEDQPAIVVGKHKGLAWMAALSPDGKTLASAGESRVVRFWTITPGVEKRFQEKAAPKAAPAPIVARTAPAKIALAVAPQQTPRPKKKVEDDPDEKPAEEVARNIQDLALVKLSAAKGVQVLERAQIERLEREQKLTLAGLVDADAALNAGKILAVDLFAVITTQPLGVVVFDAATGTKLIDVGLSATQTQQQAHETAERVRQAVAKWRGGPKNLTTVCMLPVRNADLPRGMDPFCTTLGAVLERQLLAGSGTVVLERKSLDLFNKEKGLAAQASTRELLASLVLLEMDVARAEKGAGIRATLTLRDHAGKILHRIGHEVADPQGAGLVPPLVEKIQAALNTPMSAGQANPRRESRRFVREAKVLWQHQHYLLALQAAEAACALRASDEARLLLAEYLIAYATDIIHPGGMRSLVLSSRLKFKVAPDRLREALAMARRGMQIEDHVRAGCRAIPRQGPQDKLAWDSTHWFDAFAVVDAQRHFFNKIEYLKVVPDHAEMEQELLEFRHETLRRLVKGCREAAEDAERNPSALRTFTDKLHDTEERVSMLAPSPLVYTRTQAELAKLWLETCRQHTPAAIPLDAAKSFGKFLGNVNAPQRRPHTSDPEGEALSQELLENAGKHPHPIVRLYATHHHLKFLVKAKKITVADGISRHRAMLADGKALIERPPLAPHDPFRAAVYRLLGDAIDHLYLHDKGRSVVAEYLDLCEFMLARGDVVEDVITRAVNYGSDDRALNLRALRIVDRTVQLVDSPERRLFDGHVDRLKVHSMKPARHKLLTKLPDLLKVTLPWESAQKLVSNSDLKATRLLSVFVHDKHIYVFAGGGPHEKAPRELQLVSIPVAGGAAKVLSKMLIAVDDPPEPRRHWAFWDDPEHFIAQTVVAGDRVYAGTSREGILVFPLSGGAPVRIGEKEGLPSQQVHKLTMVGNTLIAALAGGYIIAYDLETRRCTTLASSRRSDKLSPFDNAGPFEVQELLADPARKRVLFRVAGRVLDDARAGFWEYSLATGQFKKMPMNFAGTWSQVSVAEGRFYVHDTDFFPAGPAADRVFEYDLASDRLTLLHGDPGRDHAGQKPIGLPAGFTAMFPRYFYSSLLYQRGQVWQAGPFGRRSLDGKTEEFYPSPHNNDWKYSFHPHLSLQALSDTQLLIGDHEALYLMRLKD